jgi:hypothetical protein
LRHDDDGREALWRVADGCAKPDPGLPPSVGATLAGSMQEQNDGPFPTAGPVLDRHIDLIADSLARHVNGTIEKAGLLLGQPRGIPRER